MKLSDYIAKLQAILEAEGDLEVVKQRLTGDMLAGGFSFESAWLPFAADKFDFQGHEFVKSGMGPLPTSATHTGKVVALDGFIRFEMWGGGSHQQNADHEWRGPTHEGPTTSTT